ncbi:hypothetical protein SUGI_0445720 [Cryptomeria japonica]|nr:hypothetical protein SUGI_0445720 [Cryptomeria japonica]
MVKDEDGSLVGAICGPSEIVSNNVAEITALEEGLKWVIANNHPKVAIEGDSQIILNGVTKKCFTNWRLNERILRIDQLLQKLEDYQVKHIYREGNSVADLLANQGVIESQTKFISVVDSVIKDLGVLLEMDRDIIPRKGIREETLEVQCDRLFDIDTNGQEVICGIVEGALSNDRHWCDRQIYEIIMYLLVYVLPSKEACIEKIVGFVRDVDANVAGSAIMEVAAVALKAKKEEFVQNTWEVFCMGVKNDDMDPFKWMMRLEESWLSEGSIERVAAVALKAKKEEFVQNTWEVFCMGVKNDDMDPFKWMMRLEESWLSEGSIERVALIGSWVATILRLM